MNVVNPIYICYCILHNTLNSLDLGFMPSPTDRNGTSWRGDGDHRRFRQQLYANGEWAS